MPRGGRRATRRVAVVAELNLTGDSLRVALSTRGFEVVSSPMPSGPAEVRELGQRVEAFRPQAGVLLQEILEPVHLIGAMRTISELRHLRWLLLTGSPPGPPWGAGLAAGAAAVLPMSIGLHQLTDSLAGLCRGEDVMSPPERDRLLRLWTETSAAQRALVGRLASLTPREMEVLQELRRGRTVTEIAASSDVAVGTVRSQVKSILRKLDVSSQLAAVAALQGAAGPGPEDEGR